MTFAIIFLISVIALYIVICLVAGALCGNKHCKKDTTYYSVSNRSSYERLVGYIETHPERASKIICINNLTDEDLISKLNEKAGQLGFKVI